VGSPSFSPIGDAERHKALGTLVSAFTADPVERWLYPEDELYLAHFPEFLAAFGGRAFDAQTAWCVDDCAAVALWLPPGITPDEEAVVSVLSESVAPAKHEDLFSVLEQMDVVHPTYPHWYLPWIGVHASFQGQGLGAVLMTRCLEIVDADHLPAYLETPNPRNQSFYRRHGFEVTGVSQTATCPPVTFMHRAAR
jgi:ribosomal protein S18 acetylase RimI-like enzyme